MAKWVTSQKTVCGPETGLQLWAQKIDFHSCPEERLSDVGAWVGWGLPRMTGWGGGILKQWPASVALRCTIGHHHEPILQKPESPPLHSPGEGQGKGGDLEQSCASGRMVSTLHRVAGVQSQTCSSGEVKDSLTLRGRGGGPRPGQMQRDGQGCPRGGGGEAGCPKGGDAHRRARPQEETATNFSTRALGDPRIGPSEGGFNEARTRKIGQQIISWKRIFAQNYSRHGTDPKLISASRG